mgnify:CR=1 FL=1
MKLWSAEVAPNPRKVVIFLMEKGIEVETVNIDLGAKANYEPEFIAKNPLARVPVLEFDDGACLAESKAICCYFEETNPEPPLMGIDARDRAFVEMWERRMEFELMSNMTGAFRHCHPYWEGRIEQIPAYGEICKRNAEERMTLLDSELAEREYIAGDTITMDHVNAALKAQGISDFQLMEGDAVVFRTGWEQHWEDPATYNLSLIHI